MGEIHKEKKFEEAIEEHLLNKGGWLKGKPEDFKREIALDTEHLFAFIESSQPELWLSLRDQHREGLEQGILDALVKNLETRGTLDVLRKGFKFFGKKIEMAQFKPSSGLNPDILGKYKKNRLSVTRQVKFDPDSEQSIDMVLFLNGLPIATAELKNPLSGQTVENAIWQYRKDRDPTKMLFQFKKRALVHFAVDPTEVYMATRLEKGGTRFLPFNRGCNNGAGNPINLKGYKTAYLWEEIWQRDSFLDIVGRFLHVLQEEKWVGGKKKTTKEGIIFPRFHQLDVVRKLETAARTDGPGKSYLIQHSAGSGKSNSIAWLAYRLSSMHDQHDKKVYDSVVVVTDRLVLDRQLQDTIYQFEHKQGVVARIDKHSDQLAEALHKGTQIIITTLQKFPFVNEKIGTLPNRNYAVIVDEAHSSQSGEAAKTMKEVLAAGSLEEAASEEEGELYDYEDEILRVMEVRGKKKNLSFFAFTATPKAKTLEVFGHKGADDKPIPFHLYSMRQAIEEGFILDVLKHYVTYKTYYKLIKAIEDDPKVNKKKAAQSLARFMSLHPHNIAQKTEVMVEHFRQKVKHLIGGKAKAMVVTRSRLHAVRYKQAFDKYIKEKGYDISTLVAFSGTVRDPETGFEFTEVGMNQGIKEKELPEKFESDEYQVLLVNNKYQTGFDQPLLHTMYVDKRLSGVQAVQTLSRLNRTHPGKDDTFVLDFINEPEEIQRSFQPYFEQTTVAETADPQQLYDLQHKLDAMQVYYQQEVENLAKVFYKPKKQQTIHDQAEMYHYLDPAVDRFKALDQEAQDQFRDLLGTYVRLYSFMSQIMPFQDADLEKLYTFYRFLNRRLPRRDDGDPLDLDSDVALKYYRLQKIIDGTIQLESGVVGEVKGPTEVGTAGSKTEEEQLSTIIELLNNRFGTNFTAADELFFDQIKEEAKADAEVVQRAQANPFDNFALSIRQKIEDFMVERMEKNEDIVKKYLDEKEFQETAFNVLAKRIYEELKVSK
jgi:type I restriction enzyme R subunit